MMPLHSRRVIPHNIIEFDLLSHTRERTRSRHCTIRAVGLQPPHNSVVYASAYRVKVFIACAPLPP